MSQDEHRSKFGRGLHVHRTTPGSHYTLEGCVTVCGPCHVTLPRRAYGEVDLARTGDKAQLQLWLQRSTIQRLAELAKRLGVGPSAVVEQLVNCWDRLTPEMIAQLVALGEDGLTP